MSYFVEVSIIGPGMNVRQRSRPYDHEDNARSHFRSVVGCNIAERYPAAAVTIELQHGTTVLERDFRAPFVKSST